jgi:hypothetical protein
LRYERSNASIYPKLANTHFVDRYEGMDFPAHGDTIPVMPFPFLELPPELRLFIYRLLLHFSLPIPRGVKPPSSALLAACRQMHREALPILYQENVFGVHPSLLTSAPLAGLERILYYPPPPGTIKRWYITLRLDIDYLHTAEEIRLRFSGSDYLEIEATQTQYGASDYRALELFLGVRAVGKAFVHGSVSSLFAKWLEKIMTAEEGSDIPPLDFGSRDGNEYGYDDWTHRL